MIDEIKVEERLTYNPQSNEIVGCCREHSARYSFQFNSHDDLSIIHEGVRTEKTHLAKEVGQYLVAEIRKLSA
jgi:hypothetical protein